jgi:hypothetical protein
MIQFKKFSTSVLISMVRAHSAYYGRELNPDELNDCKINIDMLQAEIDSRNKLYNPIPSEEPEFKNHILC